jgi:hypothetical protein
MAETLQSHLSHPVLSFYRAQHLGQSWLISLTTVLDSCALLIAGGDGLPREQARLTYRVGLRLLRDLTNALGILVDPRCRMRLTKDELPDLHAALESSGIISSLGPVAETKLLRLVHRYDVYLFALSAWLVVPLPSWIPLKERCSETEASEGPGASND